MNALGFLFGLSLSVLAVVAAIWIVASGGSDRNALFMLFMSLLLFGWTTAGAYSQQKTDHWLAEFPGPVVISAPAWQRVLFCLVLVLFGCVPFFGGVVIELRRGDADWLKAAVACMFGCLCIAGALLQLPRRELVLGLDKLEYRSVRRTRSYHWSEFSNFYAIGRGSQLLCEFADQSNRHLYFRRSLLIAGPLGVPKSMLKTLLVAWQARALANASAQAAASRAATSDPRKRSLLDYA
jgi:hypothetical protein